MGSPFFGTALCSQKTNMLGLVLLLSEEEPKHCTVAEETLREDCCADRKKKIPGGNLPSQEIIMRWESVNPSASH